MVRFAAEGYPFLSGFLIATMFVLIFSPWAALIPLIFTLFVAYFFRDPDRNVPEGEGIIVAPADGRVILIDMIREERYLKDDVIEISIFMSPLDVHVNRAPCDGSVAYVAHSPGRFHSAFTHEASEENEHIAMILNSRHGKVLVRQVAGFLARRAVCRVKEGDSLRKGDRYGIIKFGSRVDLYLPRIADIVVKSGDYVRAGETVLALIGP
jgi:phosphatidylserine decarboxylase